MIILPGIKVKIFDCVIVASPDHRYTESLCEAGLVVNSTALSRKVGDNEATLSDLSNNPIINLFIVLLHVYPYRIIPAFV